MSQYVRYPSSGVPSGLTPLGAGNTLLGVNNAGTAFEYKSLLGTASQVIVTNNVGSITLSLPQSIGTGNTPSFAGMSLSGNLLPTVDNSYDIGLLAGPMRFRDLNLSRNALVGGDLHVQGNFLLDGSFSPASIQVGDGTIGAPSYAFSSQATLGFYKKAANTLGFTGNGTSGINFSGTTVVSNNNASTFVDFNGAGAGRLNLNSASDLTSQSGSHLTQVGFEDESHGCNAFYGYLRMSNTYGASGMDIWWQTDGGGDIGRASLRPNVIRVKDKLLATGGVGVGNSAVATTPGTVVKKIEIFDASGVSLGFIAVYDAIT